MIVLDEQLLSYGIRQHVVQWYRGAVIDITQLRVVYINRAAKESGLLQVGLTVPTDPIQRVSNRIVVATLYAAWSIETQSPGCC